MTSPLRYPGGKSRIVHRKILPLIALDYSEYREPFLGGGSVFIALKQFRPEADYWINDLNTDLCCFWKTVRDNVGNLLEEVTRLTHEYKNGKNLYRKLYEPEEFAKGKKIQLWSGMWKERKNNPAVMLEFLQKYPYFSTKYFDFLSLLRFFVIPVVSSRRVRQRIESAIARHYLRLLRTKKWRVTILHKPRRGRVL